MQTPVATTPRRRFLLTAAALLSCPAARADPLPLTIDLDLAAAPQLQAYGEEMRRRAFGWWTIINDALSFPGYSPTKRIIFRFSNDMPSTLAGLAQGHLILMNAPYITAHPTYFNYAAHEMVHIYQAYPLGTPKWLLEGIADYVRYYVLFPQDRERDYNAVNAYYTDGYQKGAALLDWVERTHGVGSVRQLNATLHRGADGEALLERMTGMRLSQIWANVAADLEMGSPVPKA